MADKFILGFPISEKTASSVMFQDGTNIGIGTNSPEGVFHTKQADATILVQDTDTGFATTEAFIKFSGTDPNGDFRANIAQAIGIKDNCLVFQRAGLETMRILSSGGITFNGDTSTSNALDDYEEGTWTPSFSNLTVTGTVSFSGTYTKIGNQVFYTAKILRISGDITSSASLTQINNLPFTVGGATSVSGGVARLGSLYVEGGMVNRESRTQAWLPAVSATGQTVVMSGTYTV